mgnify:CR=1 FL=1
MRNLAVPEIEVTTVYDACVSGIGAADKRARFNSYRPQIAALSSEYIQRANTSRIYEFQPWTEDSKTGVPVSKKELKKLYVEQMAKLGRPGRPSYETLKMTTRLCPFCGISSVRTLEHHLPKAHYPDFSITPYNLIPCCRDCNTEKRDALIRTAEEQKLHPYFDVVMNLRWLYADIVIDGGDFIAVYRTAAPDDQPVSIKLKIDSHLVTYDLGDRYSDLANGEIESLKIEMLEVYQSGGPDTVRRQLLERAESSAGYQLNHWKVALYEALANSDAYCSGQFLR